MYLLTLLQYNLARYVYYCFSGGEGVILCLYVDDILMFRTKLNVIKEL